MATISENASCLLYHAPTWRFLVNREIGKLQDLPDTCFSIRDEDGLGCWVGVVSEGELEQAKKVFHWFQCSAVELDGLYWIHFRPRVH